MSENLVKIRKDKAKRLYNEGQTIYVIPHKVRTDGMWMKPHQMNLKDLEAFECENRPTFEHRVNNYEYYNCNAELGKYSSFYIKEEKGGANEKH